MALHLSQLIEGLLEREYSQLLALPETQAALHPAGLGTWSAKEELGHLIDSAVNNHMRFVRAALEPELHATTYAQNDWVRIHGYQEMPWLTIVELWRQHNAILVPVVRRIPVAKLQTPCFVGSTESVTLEFVIGDYVLHAQHHIDHLLAREHVTEYPGK